MGRRFERKRIGAGWLAILTLLSAVAGGCSTTRCTVPATSISPSICESPRSHLQQINLIDLRMTPPTEYLLGPRDILAIYVEGIYPHDSTPPINMPQQENLPPTTGYPVPIREDGTISLPLIPPVQLEGMTLVQAEDKIRKAYTVDQSILPVSRFRMTVGLIRKRMYHVIVIRSDRSQELVSFTPGNVLPERSKGGYAEALELAAYENDVLHALVRTGGLPGISAKNEVMILRSACRNPGDAEKFFNQFQNPNERLAMVADMSAITRIPLRTPEGMAASPINPTDIILNDGDVVVVESRDEEVFYTGGLLKGGHFRLPRDYDLDVLGAIAMAGGSIGAAAGGTATSTGMSVSHGTGIIPPTTVRILRMVNGRQIPIHVNLKKAMTDPRERVLIEPNDIILLEYTQGELLANLLINNTIINFNFTRSLQ